MDRAGQVYSKNNYHFAQHQVLPAHNHPGKLQAAASRQGMSGSGPSARSNRADCWLCSTKVSRLCLPVSARKPATVHAPNTSVQCVVLTFEKKLVVLPAFRKPRQVIAACASCDVLVFGFSTTNDVSTKLALDQRDEFRSINWIWHLVLTLLQQHVLKLRPRFFDQLV
jgi:hypothetical protein